MAQAGDKLNIGVFSLDALKDSGVGLAHHLDHFRAHVPDQVKIPFFKGRPVTAVNADPASSGRHKQKSFRCANN
jgi:hypothetical protein